MYLAASVQIDSREGPIDCELEGWDVNLRQVHIDFLCAVRS